MSQQVRVLLIRLSSIGDVLHCTPVVRALKRARPFWHITWLVDEAPAELLATNPYIDQLYIWPRNRWEACLRRKQWQTALQLWQSLTRDLRAAHYDMVIDVHGLFITGLMAWLSGAPQRIGLSATREFNHWFMTEVAPARSAGMHVIQRYLNILTPIGIYSHDYRMLLSVSAAADRFATEFLQQHDVQPQQRLIAVNPATTWPNKNWPIGHYAVAIRQLSSYGRIMLCGGSTDRGVADQILNGVQVPVIDAVGKTGLLELAALLSRSQVLLTGDTGPLHMAVALGTPTVSLFGPTDPRRFGPLTGEHAVLQGKAGCRLCHKRSCSQSQLECMQSIAPSAVVEQVRRILHEPGTVDEFLWRRSRVDRPL